MGCPSRAKLPVALAEQHREAAIPSACYHQIGLLVTIHVAESHVPDDVYTQAAAVFTERELGQVNAMVVTINAWNRINVTVRTAVPRR